MKHYLRLAGIAVLFLFAACSKKGTPQPNDNGTDTTIRGTSGQGNSNIYVVKTIGISRILISVDNDLKLSAAVLYGGGNKLILKPGTGNKMEMQGITAFKMIPAALGTPDGTLPSLDIPIDNGNPPQDTSGATATVIKLKGFDKQKYGYNQLNLVMCKFVWANEHSSESQGSYWTNLTYLNFFIQHYPQTIPYYGTSYIKSLFTGNIAVTDLEIAKPKSEHPYIVEDQIITGGQASADLKTSQKTVIADLRSFPYRSLFVTGQGENVGSPIKMAWVNADKGAVKKIDDYTYQIMFDNAKTGDVGQIVEPPDSVSRPFLRISGLNPAITGFNQIRLFVGSDNIGNDGSLQLIVNIPQTTAPTFAFIRDAYLTPYLNCFELRPQWLHF